MRLGAELGPLPTGLSGCGEGFGLCSSDSSLGSSGLGAWLGQWAWGALLSGRGEEGAQIWVPLPAS